SSLTRCAWGWFSMQTEYTPSSPSTPTPTNQKIADIVFLVDGSFNLGKANFHEVMEFIKTLLEDFGSDTDDLRIGLAQFTTDVTDAFFLNTYKNREDIGQAIVQTEYKGGNRINTGAAIRHVQQRHFVKEKGSRKDEGIPQILMIVTGGVSSDDGETAALGLKNSGVRIYTIGLGNKINEAELNKLASEPVTAHRTRNVQGLSELTEPLLITLEDEMQKQVCTDKAESGEYFFRKCST
uniref:VWFA domain-containing protein n=1 Tax=Denticeps clupeoides TaxID=299321 RepID=A0AAY4CBJ0_9TELE